MQGQHPQNVLIVLLGAIGDVVRGLPLAVRIKRAWPQARLSWAVEPKSRSVLENHPAIDELLVFDRPGGFRAFRSFLREIRARHFDLVLDLQRHFKSGVVSWSSRASRRLGFHRRDAKEFNWLLNTDHLPRLGETVPKIQHYQAFGDLLGLPPLFPLEFQLQATPAETARAEELLRRASAEVGIPLPPLQQRVLFVPAGMWLSRRWPAARFQQLAIRLYREFGVVSYLAGGPAEADVAQAIRQGVTKVPVGSLIGKTTLRDLIAVLPLVRAAIGVDSGPMHLAAAVGTPTVSVWGPTDPVRTAPSGSPSIVLRPAIGCAPCYRRLCPGLENLCLSDIPAEAVYQAARPLFSKA